MYFRVELPPSERLGSKRLGRGARTFLVVESDDVVRTWDEGDGVERIEVEISQMIRILSVRLKADEVSMLGLETWSFAIADALPDGIPPEVAVVSE